MKLAGWLLRSLIFLVSTAVLLEVYFRVEDRVLRGIPLLASNATGMDSLFNFDEVGKYGRPHASYRNLHLNAAGFRGSSPSSMPRSTFQRTISTSPTSSTLPTSERT